MSLDEALILTYVPESEYLSFGTAILLAERRDAQAAYELAASCSAA